MNRLALSLLGLVLCSLNLLAQAPNGYYEGATGKRGAALKTALHSIIKGHTVRKYNDLWKDFQSTDARPDGKVWDMYSNIPQDFSNPHSVPKGGQEGSAYNREHSFPKSWFRQQPGSPMYTDLFHLIPTDASINSLRGNFPYGETRNPKKTSNGGFSKFGPCNPEIGYTGNVFEPNDEYKGDLARHYFYMATRYEDLIASWDTEAAPMLGGNRYPAYSAWAIKMLLRWAKEDPVSKKEIDRNNAVYKIQKNRNPFVDFPGLEQYVWGADTLTIFNPDSYASPGGSTPPNKPDTVIGEVRVPVFSHPAGTLRPGTAVSITSNEAHAIVYYSINDAPELTGPSPVTLTIDSVMTIKARVYARSSFSDYATVTYRVSQAGGKPTGGKYRKVKNNTELEVGAQYLIVYESGNRALGRQTDAYRSYTEVVCEAEAVDLETLTEQPAILTLGGQADAWTLADGDQGWLAYTGDKNTLSLTQDVASAEAQWTIDVSGGHAVITNKANADRTIYYNSSSPRFACYLSSSRQKQVTLYKLGSTLTALSSATLTAPAKVVNVYTLQGSLVISQATPAEISRLPQGLYIIGNRKVVIR